MTEHNEPSNSHHADSHLDAFAAVALIMLAVVAAVFWVSQQ